MSWIAWDKLTLPKGSGGLGFRDIEAFNDALLAKIGWRLLKEPDSLLAQVLLGKYCHSSSFLNVGSRSVMSHGWRGILAGREIIRKGIGWVVGTGEEIPIWGSPWLAHDAPLLPYGPEPTSPSPILVADLISPGTGSWNLAAIRHHLPQYEVLIRQIILSMTPARDIQVWLFEKSGLYTTKSGYNLMRDPTGFGRGRFGENFNWFKAIWSLSCPPKIKIFLWKLANNALPVGEALRRRGFLMIGGCKRCGSPEDELHLVFHCTFASQLWDIAPVMARPDVTTSSISQLLTACLRCRNLPPSGICTSLVPWLLWAAWKARNLLLFENRNFTPAETILKVQREAKEWQEAQPSRLQPARQLSLDLAVTPSQSQIRCFVDAAWQASSLYCGMGWCFLNTDNEIVSRHSLSRRFIRSALVAEALAVREALLSALDVHLPHVRIFSDSQSLISLILAKDFANEIRSILVDIYSISTSFVSLSFAFVPRSRNLEADRLAKEALAHVALYSIVGT